MVLCRYQKMKTIILVIMCLMNLHLLIVMRNNVYAAELNSPGRIPLLVKEYVDMYFISDNPPSYSMYVTANGEGDETELGIDIYFCWLNKYLGDKQYSDKLAYNYESSKQCLRYIDCRVTNKNPASLYYLWLRSFVDIKTNYKIKRVRNNYHEGRLYGYYVDIDSGANRIEIWINDDGNMPHSIFGKYKITKFNDMDVIKKLEDEIKANAVHLRTIILQSGAVACAK